MKDLQQLPIRYDYYLAQAEGWADLFKSLDFSRRQIVLEICSGWSPKIGLALVRNGFSGTLILNDVNSSALQTNTALLEPVARDFTFQLLIGNIFELKNLEVDLILMNHALDDILLFSVLAEAQTRTVFDDPYALRQLWIESEPIIQKKVTELAKKLAIVLNAGLKKNGQLIIHQYAGYQEKLYAMEKALALTSSFHHTLNLELGRHQLQKLDLPPQTSPQFKTIQIWRKI